MKKLLVGTAAIALGLAMTAPASAADGVKLGVGGYFKGYMSWLDQDDGATLGASTDNYDILRDTEVHFSGETTLDNGLTVGFNTELLDDQADGFAVQESYAYFSGSWGRVNFGAEDGAAYLLQVAAPSADSNVDGLRQYVHGVNYTNIADVGGATDPALGDLFTGTVAANDLVSFGADGADDGTDDVQFGDRAAGYAVNTVFDYDQALSAFDDKITYLTPVFSGFQFGVSYAPNLDATSDGVTPHPSDNVDGDYDGAWDIAGRWEGTFDRLGITLGGGYSHASLQNDGGAGVVIADVVSYVDADNGETWTAGEETAVIDDRDVWNVGLDLNWGAFGLGGAFTRDNIGISDGFDRETWVVGGDYTTGPYKIGLSYLDQTQDIAVREFDTTRWTGGVVYTYGPGMTFRGSVAWMDYEEDVGTNADATGDEGASSTNFLLGTQIDF